MWLLSEGIGSPELLFSSACIQLCLWTAARSFEGWWAQTSQRENAAYCTDHRSVQGSHIASVISRRALWNRQSSFVSGCFLSSGKQGQLKLPPYPHPQRQIPQSESETSELDLPLADNSSRAHWLVTKGSHFWMTGSSVPFQKFTSLIHRSWHGTSLPWNEIGVFLVEQLFFFFFFNRQAQQIPSSADSSGWEWGWRGGWSFPCFSAPGLHMNRAEKTRIEALSIWSSSRKLTTLNCSRAGRRTTERSRSIGFWSHPPWPFTTHQSQSIVRQDFPSVNKKRGSDTLEGPSLASGTEVRFNRVTALNPPSQLACPCLDCPPWTRFLFSQSITLSS